MRIIFRAFGKLQEVETHAMATQSDRTSHWKYYACIKISQNNVLLSILFTLTWTYHLNILSTVTLWIFEQIVNFVFDDIISERSYIIEIHFWVLQKIHEPYSMKERWTSKPSNGWYIRFIMRIFLFSLFHLRWGFFLR